MQFFSWLAELLTLTGGCLGLFTYVERCNGTELRNRVFHWLNGTIPFRAQDNWAKIFADAFDGVFGLRFVSLRFITMSAISSILFVFLLLLMWVTLYPNEATRHIGTTYSAIVVIGVIFALTNLIPDYLSNCQTRYILGKLVSSSNPANLGSNFRIYLKWLTIDLALTTALSAVVVVPISIGFYYLVDFLSIFESVEIPSAFDLGGFLSLPFQ